MRSSESPWRPSVSTVVAASLVIAGFGLSGVSWWFFLLVGLGAFGPGVLRELGWLDDRDEFQLQAARRAGYHAFLVAGLVSVGLVAMGRSGAELGEAGELSALFLAVLWFTWFFSSLLDYWGAQRTASRVLYAFGAVWLVFNILANTGSEWTGPTALVLQSLLALPFFGLGWLSSRFPRAAGGLLLAASAGFFGFLGMLRNDNLALATQGIVMVLFVGPMLASGLALLVSGDSDSDEGFDDELVAV